MRGERFGPLRKSLLENVEGTVLEVGFGSGLNLPCFSGKVRRLYALDPSQLGRRLAKKRIGRAPFPVEFVEWSQGRIELPERSVDAVVTTWTLCTIPQPIDALNEIQRVLKREGRYHFLEHGLSPDPWVARVQHLWNPFQKRLAGGCHVNRKIDRLVEASRLQLIQLENFYMEGPKIFTYLYRGAARPE